MIFSRPIGALFLISARSPFQRYLNFSNRDLDIFHSISQGVEKFIIFRNDFLKSIKCCALFGLSTTLLKLINNWSFGRFRLIMFLMDRFFSHWAGQKILPHLVRIHYNSYNFSLKQLSYFQGNSQAIKSLLLPGNRALILLICFFDNQPVYYEFGPHRR